MNFEIEYRRILSANLMLQRVLEKMNGKLYDSKRLITQLRERNSNDAAMYRERVKRERERNTGVVRQSINDSLLALFSGFIVGAAVGSIILMLVYQL